VVDKYTTKARSYIQLRCNRLLLRRSIHALRFEPPPAVTSYVALRDQGLASTMKHAFTKLPTLAYLMQLFASQAA